MKIMKLIICSLFVLLSLQGVATPAEAEYGKLYESWNLRADGSQEYRCYKELTLFTHTAMNSTYGESFIGYNPRFQELKIHDSYTRQKDGTIVRTPANAFVEVLPRDASAAPAYNHLKEMVVVHTGLELGATLVLDYSIISQPGYLPEIDILQHLQQSSPVKDYRLTFRFPAEKHARYETLATNVQPVITQENGQQQLQWKFRNMPALSRAPEANLQNGDIPGIVFTTYASPQEALQTIYKQFEQTPGTEITAKAKELTANCKNDREKLKVIREFVAGHTDHCSLTPATTGFRLRPATEVLHTAYGTSLEQLNLFNALLNASGIQAQPAATYNTVQHAENCGLNSVREYVVLAKIEDRNYVINPQTPYQAAADCPFLISLENGKLIRQTPCHNSIDYSSRITLTETEATSETEASFSANNIPCHEHFATELIRGIQKPEIRTKENKTSLHGTVKTNLQKTDGYILMPLPSTNKGIEQYAYARYNSSRNVNLKLPYTTTENYSYQILFSSGMQVQTPAKEKKIDNPVGTLLISIQPDKKGISVQRSLQLKKQLITPAEYPLFRELITEWSSPNNRQILFKAEN